MEEEIQIKKYTCERCKHSWISRIKTMPKFCPSCKSEYWNIPRKTKKEKK